MGTGSELISLNLGPVAPHRYRSCAAPAQRREVAIEFATEQALRFVALPEVRLWTRLNDISHSSDPFWQNVRGAAGGVMLRVSQRRLRHAGRSVVIQPATLCQRCP